MSDDRRIRRRDSMKYMKFYVGMSKFYMGARIKESDSTREMCGDVDRVCVEEDKERMKITGRENNANRDGRQDNKEIEMKEGEERSDQEDEESTNIGSGMKGSICTDQGRDRKAMMSGGTMREGVDE